MTTPAPRAYIARSGWSVAYKTGYSGAAIPNKAAAGTSSEASGAASI